MVTAASRQPRKGMADPSLTFFLDYRLSANYRTYKNDQLTQGKMVICESRYDQFPEMITLLN